MYEKIAEILKERGKTFSWLSEKTGISIATFSMLKKRKSLNYENGLKVAKALKISPWRLI